MAVPLAPDFEDDDAEDEEAMYARMRIEAQKAENPKQYEKRKTPKVPVLIEVEQPAGSVVEVDNPFQDVDVQIIGQKRGGTGVSIMSQAICCHR